MPTTGQRNAQTMRELKSARLKSESKAEKTRNKKFSKKRTEKTPQNLDELIAKKLSRNPIKAVPYKPGMGNLFYQTKEWMKVRWACLHNSDGKCNVCGRSKQDGAILHVDHIKPRSKYPELELTPSNLQILCKECNLGKGGS